jgi:signal transduction histidine kinase
VNDWLDLAKIEAGRTEVRTDTFPVESLWGALRAVFRPIETDEAVSLIFEPPPPLPLLYTDESKVAQILRNFISNALKFTERGEVRVAVSEGPNDTVVFSVADTGIGIAPEHVESVFIEFAQIDNPMQRRVKGTGLGLPLSRRLARLLGGDIALQSQLGSGSVFTLTLPVLYAQSDEAAGGSNDAGGQPQAEVSHV